MNVWLYFNVYTFKVILVYYFDVQTVYYIINVNTCTTIIVII